MTIYIKSKQIMNYFKIYNDLINRAKDRKLTDYVEKHHIVPKCIGGLDTKENLVELTPKEHFLAHLLLVEMYPYSKELKYASWAMANQTRYRNYKITGSIYQRLKEDFIKNKTLKVKIHCDHCKKLFSRQPSHLKDSNFCSRKCYVSYGGFTKGEVHIYKGKEKKFISKEDIEKYLEQGWKKGRPSLQKPVAQKSLGGNLIKVFSSVKEATVNSPFSVTGISQCAHGKRKSHRGFKWEYLDGH